LNGVEITKMSKLGIYLKLEGEIKDHFLAIKKAKGLKNDTEVLRLIITEYYDKHLLPEKSARWRHDSTHTRVSQSIRRNN